MADPLGAMVGKCTHESLLDVNWTLNMELCDHVAANPSSGKAVLAALAKRLASPNPKVLQLSLSVRGVFGGSGMRSVCVCIHV